MKNILFKRLGAAVLILTLLISVLAGCSSNQSAGGNAATGNPDTFYRTVDEIIESGTINIGVFYSANPISKRTESWHE